MATLDEMFLKAVAVSTQACRQRRAAEDDGFTVYPDGAYWVVELDGAVLARESSLEVALEAAKARAGKV